MPKHTMKKHTSILIKNADYVVTLSGKRPVLKNTSILLEDNYIKELPTTKVNADTVIDARGMVVYPGFINTHLHIPQVFHRHCPAQQNKPIADWIAVTTSINMQLSEEAMYWGALVCFAELLLSGCTTTLDYFYPFAKGKKGTMEATLQAAKDIGIRLTSIRGSMSQSKKQGTLYNEGVVEDTQTILHHSQQMIEKYHDISQYSMTRIGVGPCLPFASILSDYAEVAALARRYPGVILQTHAAESIWEVEYCKKKFGLSPIGVMNKSGFLGPDVSLAHCNIISKQEIALLGKTKTNVVLTPICNTRDASDGNGIAPISNLLAAGANISIGVDGPASNDSLNLQDEMRYLRVVSRAKEGLFWHNTEDQSPYSYFDPLTVLQITNIGGAKTLNRTDIGTLEVGKAADLAIFDPDHEINHAGAVNKWGALLSCNAIRPKYLFINGKLIVKDGKLKTINIHTLNETFRKHHKKAIFSAQKQLGKNLIDYI
jgi:8-oxoguanine deaminase